jgi:hypothetical protein
MFPLLGMLGAIGMSLETDKSTYKVGEIPIYRVRGAIPNSTISFSSWLNGQQTGEYQAAYGSTVDANGTAEVTGDAWTDTQKGQWTKYALVVKPDGSYDVSNQVSFSVVGVAVPTNPTNPINTGGFLDGNITLPIIGSVPKLPAYAGIGIGLYLLLGTKRH